MYRGLLCHEKTFWVISQHETTPDLALEQQEKPLQYTATLKASGGSLRCVVTAVRMLLGCFLP